MDIETNNLLGYRSPVAPRLKRKGEACRQEMGEGRKVEWLAAMGYMTGNGRE
ncbi:conserved hypothetical protein [Ricinus communis]|uniref:Uncharacterized protein n=1 Tax=Ricinus communis TaxID=3988 RepID=B9T5G7_RICCO|nr:conserved hypothetical protein [Ricinus communis]